MSSNGAPAPVIERSRPSPAAVAIAAGPVGFVAACLRPTELMATVD